MNAGTRLERVVAAGHFALTVEIGPPRGANPESVLKKAALLKGLADGYNVTDNQTAVVRMSSIASAKILLDAGLEPVMQMTCRDRNRIAIQSDLLGASAFGIKNCLCLSGDHQKASAAGKLKGHPGAKNVFDIDSVQLLAVLKGLRDEAVQEGGDSVDQAVPFFIGAAWTPLSPPLEFRVHRLAKKAAAGADFIQTQAVYDIAAFARQVAKAREMGLTDRVAVLGGVIVPRSAKMLQYMNQSVPGVTVPDQIVKRMADAPSPKQEGIRIAVELIQAMREIKGLKGVHLQAIEAEEILPEIIKAAGLSPRPSV
ncbi:MAG: methylenetetrahydrofolate reductase [Deltaproteobacteria bacterium]|nr:methylenetetrahydrofolate reductase [Deltaproteobacteria bacterium]